MSHVKLQISIQAFVRGKVLALLGLSEAEYGDYVMQQGETYLFEQLGCSNLGKKLAANALFWAWWRNHWHDVDMEFITEVKHMSRHEMRQYYELLHDPKAFVFTPQSVVFKDAIDKINNPKIIKHQL